MADEENPYNVPDLGHFSNSVADESTIHKLPGFYYDHEKERYFKIEGAGTAAKSAYTTGSVKKRQAQDLQGEKSAKKAKSSKRAIKRGIHIDSASARLSVIHGSGIRNNLDTRRLVLATGLLNGGQIASLKINQNAPRVEPIFSAKACSYLGVDAVEIHSGPCTTSRFRFVGSHSLRLSMIEDADPNRGITTSISAHRGTGLFATSQDVLNRQANDIIIGVWGGASGGLYTTHPYTDRSPHVFCSAAAPSPSPYLFAFGTSKGILNLAPETQNFGRFKNPRDSTFKSLSCYAVTFLDLPSSPSNGQALVFAAKAGFIHRLDFRDSSSTGPEDYLRHPTEVTNIKHVNENHLLVTGQNNKMSLYDMRFLKPWGLGQKVYLPYPAPKSTTPIVAYPEYRSPSGMNHAIDVDIESGIIAVAQPSHWNSNPRVQLFSVSSGNVLPSPLVNRKLLKLSKCLEKYKFTDETGADLPKNLKYEKYEGQPRPPKCIQWVKEREGAMSCLYVSEENGSISRYDFRGGEDEH